MQRLWNQRIVLRHPNPTQDQCKRHFVEAGVLAPGHSASRSAPHPCSSDDASPRRAYASPAGQHIVIAAPESPKA